MIDSRKYFVVLKRSLILVHINIELFCFLVQPFNEGRKLETLMTELNAYYNDESNCREMNIHDVCEGKCFAAGIVLSGCYHLSVPVDLH